MKFVLIILISVLVVGTHQYFHHRPREMPWVSPYLPHSFIVYLTKPNPPTSYPTQSEDLITDYVAPDSGKRPINADELYTFPDTRLRFKGFSRDQASNSNDQLDARLLFANNGIYTNPFLKTVTFTYRTSLSLTSYVTCVPANQLLNGAGATYCRRKRRTINVAADEIAEGNQFLITPSETQKLATTAISSPSRNLDQLSSSKDDAALEELSAIDQSQIRRQRLLFLNRNQFVISSTVTSFSFSNATVTVTKNLFNANQAVQCLAAPDVNMPQCIACLPPGFIVCNASG
ncbi:uncharacterized protein LOC116935079 [Daphnia magna]|uniref:uncharacterized protein LOC116935079 n=1 Tax=Daphnia magna TaxID=35525 RepID=UPI001E1BC175|nr:uncharacterized protein LOC116935079 [Daphnia magna]